MKATQTIKGRISEGLHGLGTVTESMVRQRAKEIALINGRSPNQLNEADFEAARAELTGGSALDEQQEEDSEPMVASLRDVTPGSSGHKIAPKLPSDEQRVAEELVQEGVDEAEHNSMLAGSTTDTNQNS